MWNLNKWTDHTALYVREQSYTYGQLDRMQQAFAQKVDSHRLVCVMMTNELPALVAYISCIQNHCRHRRRAGVRRIYGSIMNRM